MDRVRTRPRGPIPKGLDARIIGLAEFLGQFGQRGKLFFAVFNRLRWGADEARAYINTCGGFEAAMRMALGADYDLDNLVVEWKKPEETKGGGKKPDGGAVQVSTPGAGAVRQGSEESVSVVSVRTTYRKVYDDIISSLAVTELPASVFAHASQHVITPVLPVVVGSGCVLPGRGEVEESTGLVGLPFGPFRQSVKERERFALFEYRSVLMPDTDPGIRTELFAFGCGECMKRFETTFDLIQHLMRVHPPRAIMDAGRESACYCGLCSGVEFTDVRSLELHVRKHEAITLVARCKCGRAFSDHHRWVDHVEGCGREIPRSLGRERNEEEDLELCSCGESHSDHAVWESPYGAAAEREKVIGTNSMVVRTNYDAVCQWVVNTEFGKLDTRYMQLFHSPRNGPIGYEPPEVCYSTPGYIINTHGGVAWRSYDFLCAVCGYEVNDKNLLASHVKAHKHGPYKRYVCNRCDIPFSTVGWLAGHAKTHMRIRDVLQADTGYSCVHCGTRFSRPSELSRHMRLHKSSLYSCECGKSFQRFDNYTRHRSSMRCLQRRSRIRRGL